MMNRREYEIAFVGLKPGVHEFNYEVTDKFFEPYQPQDFTNCKAQVKLTLDKKTGFMMLKFDVAGSVETLCDRCGNPLTQQLWDEFNMLVKMVDEPETMNDQEEDPDVFYISRNESHLHIADWLYEFINLSVPNQKICATNDKGESGCNPEVLAKLRKMEDSVKLETNPLWKGLEKFKDIE